MRGTAVGLVMLATVGVTACTTETGSTPSDAAPTSTTEETTASSGFAREYQEVAERYSAGAEELQVELQQIPEGDRDRLVAVVEALRDGAADARADLAELSIPSEVSGEMTTVLQLLDDQVAALDQLVESVEEGDTGAFRSATEALVDIAQRSAEARRRIEVAIAACGTACA